ncbi:MAG: epoxyqueuosine reductase QueH [Firmicutes bacterium]|nr:epoxyqueuosine reductase QueH [Candidatus Fermentithermobacillaceae bacterium]
MRLLLHSCCGPCTTYPLHFYRAQGLIVEGIYFNPNIYPEEEEEKRWETYASWSRDNHLPVRRICVPHSQWLYAVSHDLSKPARCDACYLFRLKEVARLAKEEGYDLFSTTLLVSPYQDHRGIVNALSMASLEHGIPYIYNDLSRGYLRSRQMARGYHMYMQKYCGCEFSMRGEK